MEVVRKKYKDLVKRYRDETDVLAKIEKKYKFAEWLKLHYTELSDAEIEYLMAGICYVEL